MDARKCTRWLRCIKISLPAATFQLALVTVCVGRRSNWLPVLNCSCVCHTGEAAARPKRLSCGVDSFSHGRPLQSFDHNLTHVPIISSGARLPARSIDILPKPWKELAVAPASGIVGAEWVWADAEPGALHPSRAGWQMGRSSCSRPCRHAAGGLLAVLLRLPYRLATLLPIGCRGPGRACLDAPPRLCYPNRPPLLLRAPLFRRPRVAMAATASPLARSQRMRCRSHAESGGVGSGKRMRAMMAVGRGSR